MTTMSHNPTTSNGSRSVLVSVEDTLKSPKPTHHHLFLNKPLAGNGSSVSISDITSPTTPGFRAHLGHLLPRHTYFRAKILIHQISSVPFVSGEFGVRWKLKGVQAPSVHKQGEPLVGSDRFQELPSPGAPTEDGHVGGSGRSSALRSPPVSRSSTPSVSSRSSHTDRSQQLSADWGTVSSLGLSSNSSVATVAPSSSTTSTETPGILSTPSLFPASNTPARGMTPFLKLKDHSVVWSYLLDPILRLDIDRETSQILPNPLKLVVMQRVIPGDPQGSPQNPRLGAVYLNLAEYVGQGSVERRYLLKESKTNATLKLTIEMEYVSGETLYIPPPLAKGEILTGIAGFLENDILEIDLLGTAKSARLPRTARTARQVSDKSHPLEIESDANSENSDDGENAEDGTEAVGVAFDVQRLPFAYGTKTTEMLIEALFNPSRITEKREESPFTYYEPHHAAGGGGGGQKPKPEDIGLGLSGVILDRNATIGKRQGSLATTASGSESMYSTSSSSASVHTTAATSESSPKSRSREAGSRSLSIGESYTGVVAERSAPEGRVVVGVQQKQVEEDASSSGHGVRRWWRRHARPMTPTRESS
ncbi:N-terminal C2 in EEIG1 and EHBP1 proteins-domain-containing protein [Flammula alnicola]|nr:N-terminal C2 in EEIG1 and EHBP1 proteins-domain-containing protein [Flammula alnicola]